MQNNAPILQLIKSSVRTTDPDAILILYGSYARGNNRDNSDMDILVLIDKDKVTFDDRKRIGYPLYDISMDNNILISPKIFSKKAWETKYRITPFYKNVIREGIVL